MDIVIWEAQGLVQETYNCYLEALHTQPSFAIAWSNPAGLSWKRVILRYDKVAVKLKPTFEDTYMNIGNVCKALGMPEEAIICYQHALQGQLNYAWLWHKKKKN